MRIEIIEVPLIDDIEIQIKCKEKNEYVKKLAATIFEEQLIINGRIKNEYTQISSRDIYYFESVDNKTYIYCKDNVYQSDMKLYELEEKLYGTKFTRINKACIMNIEKLKKVKGQINGRLLATLSNGEKLVINRSYVQEVKRKLNI
ncbi:LytTR family DNA-binding domain-containing protein [Clostridium beijerinckii]|uniref:LytTr DNA-binding domain protein n=1 Tax=Clostridium beijerinckii TaxID=1520 RepID=A0A1S8RIV9_CLOBE|nr:LytTR family DNA-binding domain-containing protein [Clostridium beijerinckii]NRY59392.1 DNA-binding LytR/AlgR family response regulator [Clostridium beijerinckii]OOM53063.1 LytTr DNA-binding domain protein [Clostridium beijerinckii]